MFNFMLGVLGSNLFWICYTIASFMATVVIMRHFRANEYAALLGKKKDANGNKVDSGAFSAALVQLLAILVLWPAIAFIHVVLQFVKIILLKLAGGAVHKLFLAVDKMTPEISVSFGDKEEAKDK